MRFGLVQVSGVAIILVGGGACSTQPREAAGRAVCGNGLVELDERCDDGLENSNEWSLEPHCNTSCSGVSPYCGDGRFDANEEFCDFGSSNGDDWSTLPHCNATCSDMAAYCGDGTIDDDEECDDGLENSDGWDLDRHCNTSCSEVSPYCGDGRLDTNEESCDQGSSNSDDWMMLPHCNATCSGMAAHCGDGTIDGDEEFCDQGLSNSDDWSMLPHCNATCSGMAAYCGDGTIDGDEECDDGLENSDEWNVGRRCNTTCSDHSPYCGDGVVDTPFETCDQAAINSDLWSLNAHCNASCSGYAPFCGDGWEDSSESCDDGFNDACGTCNVNCSGPGTASICGDGVRCPEIEACDDGFADSCGDCNIDCSAEGTGAVCGDSQICPQYEECDDGNAVETDSCTAACQPARCGDMIVQDGIEQCDDGNHENGDDCLDTCEVATCGDGFVQDGVETCDDAASAYVAVRGKDSAYCGRRTSGRVDCWHEYADWTLTLDGSFVEVAGSDGYACGIRVDGTASCVCDRSRVYGPRCDVIEAISPGLYHRVSVGDFGPCLLSVDGQIECLEAGVYPPIPATLPGQYSQVSVGESHVCGILSATGEVVCEGRAGFEAMYGPLTPPAGVFGDIAVGYFFACGLRANGAIECWDIDDKGPVPVPTGSFVEINTSYGGICARDAAGSVVCWGNDGFLDGDSGVNNSPAEPFISVARANKSACGVKTDGSLVCWGEFAGSLPVADCAADCGVVGGSCEGIPEGTEESRVRYLEESVPSGSTCTSETQVRTCTGGVWGDWSGTYTYMSCTVELASCDGTPSGGDDSRVRYLEASVPSGSTCTSETQVRTCTDGVWSDWSGTYTYVSCTVELASCDGTPSGGDESRVRYLEASVPSGSTCTFETQVRTCTDGVWSDWSGTYTYSSCVVESPSVYVCDQHTTLGLGVCHEFSGANAEADRDASCAAGIAGTACPMGALGFCDLGGVSSNPPGYGQWHYASTYISDAAASNSLCTAAGGTWSPP